MDTLYAIAYSMLKQVSADMILGIHSRGMSDERFFNMPTYSLACELGIRESQAPLMEERQTALDAAKREEDFCLAHNIRVRSCTDADYPSRLSFCPDRPICIYTMGDTDLEATKTLAIVGTRRATPYGMSFVRSLLAELGETVPNLVIVSGLALGIDAAAHFEALRNHMPTIGVLAHGLSTIYPSEHRTLAKNMLASGGMLLTEFPSGTKPFRGNFLQRNRIIAGLTDATLVVESDIKGGAMSTANHAFGYSREVMALPGRFTDVYSRGCNRLIASQKSHLITSAADVRDVMGWASMVQQVMPKQGSLFDNLSEDQLTVVNALQAADHPLTIDYLHATTGVAVRDLQVILCDLEFDGIVGKYPGNTFAVL